MGEGPPVQVSSHYLWLLQVTCDSRESSDHAIDSWKTIDGINELTCPNRCWAAVGISFRWRRIL